MYSITGKAKKKPSPVDPEKGGDCQAPAGGSNIWTPYPPLRMSLKGCLILFANHIPVKSDFDKRRQMSCSMVSGISG